MFSGVRWMGPAPKPIGGRIQTNQRKRPGLLERPGLLDSSVGGYIFPIQLQIQLLILMEETLVGK